MSGTTWTQPCPAASDGLHYYRRPVVAVDFLNDARREYEKLRAAALAVVEAHEAGDKGATLGSVERLRTIIRLEKPFHR